jgi:hypothetical protein
MMERIDVFDDFRKGIRFRGELLTNTGEKTEYAVLYGPLGSDREHSYILFARTFAEMIEIPEVQTIFRKYGIQFVYQKPMEKVQTHRRQEERRAR